LLGKAVTTQENPNNQREPQEFLAIYPGMKSRACLRISRATGF
jgi:hypothetical protein